MITRSLSRTKFLFPLGLMAGLWSCGGTIKRAGSFFVVESKTVDGSGESAPPLTTVTLEAESGTAWTKFTIDLGAQFLAENICAGKTIFGRLGEAACFSVLDNRFNDVGESTKRLIPQTGRDDDGYAPLSEDDGFGDETPVEYIRTLYAPDLTAQPACGESGSVAERVASCDFEWNWGTLESNVDHGRWSLVTKTTSTGAQVWRDDRTGLVWSDNLGTTNHCIASGSIENFDQAAATVLYGESPAGNGWGATMLFDCAAENPDPDAGGPFVGRSWCAESSILETPSSLDEAKGGLRAPVVEWRLPTREDYLHAYANGLGYVIPNFLNDSLVGPWTASIASSDRGTAWSVTASSIGSFSFFNDPRSTVSPVRCVGR